MSRDDRIRYAVWAASRVSAVAIVFLTLGAAPAAFVAGFATCEIAFWRAKSREQHWREMAGKMAARVQELQTAENARVAADAQRRIDATRAVPPSREKTRDTVTRIVADAFAAKRRDVH